MVLDIGCSYITGSVLAKRPLAAHFPIPSSCVHLHTRLLVIMVFVLHFKVLIRLCK